MNYPCSILGDHICIRGAIDSNDKVYRTWMKMRWKDCAWPEVEQCNRHSQAGRGWNCMGQLISIRSCVEDILSGYEQVAALAFTTEPGDQV